MTLPLSDEEYNKTGTFLFPPATQSYEQFISFWENVPVDDEILGTISFDYEERIDEIYDDAWGEHSARWAVEKKIDLSDLENRPYDTKLYNEEYARWRREFSKRVPPEIPAQDARQIVRAGQIAHYAEFLPHDDKERALDHVVPLSGGTRTVKQLNDAFGLHEMRPSFSHPDAVLLRRLSATKVADHRNTYNIINTLVDGFSGRFRS